MPSPLRRFLLPASLVITLGAVWLISLHHGDPSIRWNELSGAGLDLYERRALAEALRF